MTIEEILNIPNVEELEKLTDAQILELYKDYLVFTRPELAEKPKQSGPRKLSERTLTYNAKKQRAMELARQAGIMDLDL